MEAIRTEALSKTYTLRSRKPIPALKPLNLAVRQGEIFGLLGPNGAGKTTLIKLLLGIASPTAGQAWLFEKKLPSRSARELLGFLPENHRYPQHLTAEQTLAFYGNLSGMSGKALKKRSDELLEMVSLLDRKKQRIKEYSKGMLQRLGLAQALLNHPKILFLDEPTDGIDPVGRKEIREILQGLKMRGVTIFLNSHLLSEVELITDRVAIMDHGEILQMGKTHELTESPGIYRIKIEWHPGLSDMPGVLHYDRDAHELEVRAETRQDLNAMIDQLRSRDVMIEGIIPKRSSLEELFISLVGQQ